LSDEADQETDSDDDVAPVNVKFAGVLGASESTGCGAGGGGGGGGVALGAGGGVLPPDGTGAGAGVPLPAGEYPGDELPGGGTAGVAHGAVLDTTDAAPERLPARS
jgi:hypothetical protein